MRPTCTYCARKHLAQAQILVNEAAMGYPDHLWLAIGHMAEASEELIATYPDVARQIRGYRKGLEQGGTAPFMELIAVVGKLPPLTTTHEHGPEEMADKIARWNVEAAERTAPAPTVGRPLTDSERKTVEEAMRLAGVSKPTPPNGTGPGTVEGNAKIATMAATIGAPSPGPCLTCGDKAHLTAVVTALRTENSKPRLVILTTLADFNPSYSLVSVILEQAHAAILAGYRVFLFVHRNANLSACPPLPPEISVLPIVPTMAWRDDGIDEAMALTYRDAMREWFWELGSAGQPLNIITHDLLFQAAYTTFAKAIHSFWAVDWLHWYHMAHSSVGPRPSETYTRHGMSGHGEPDLRAKPIWYRCMLPPGHKLIALNYADVPMFRAYYRVGNAMYPDDGIPLPDESVVTLLNSKDIRPFARMTMTASKLVTRYQLHRADVTVIYPMSLTRAFDKGVDKVIALMGALKRLGQNPPTPKPMTENEIEEEMRGIAAGTVAPTRPSGGLSVKLVLIMAHANDRVEAPKIIERIKEHARVAGLSLDNEATWLKINVLEKPIYMPAYGPGELVITSEALPDTAAYGLTADDVRSLWQVANLFVFPTISEAGSLVLMEAALAGCTMVLNGSLPALRDYIPMELAEWVPWGSLKAPAQFPANMGVPASVGQQYADLAERVWDRMGKNEGQILKRRIMQQHSLEAYGAALSAILYEPEPEPDDVSTNDDTGQAADWAVPGFSHGTHYVDEVGHILTPDQVKARAEIESLASDTPLARHRAAFKATDRYARATAPLLPVLINGKAFVREHGITDQMTSKQIAALVGIHEGKVCRCDHNMAPLAAPSDDNEYIVNGVRDLATWNIEAGDCFLVTRERQRPV